MMHILKVKHPNDTIQFLSNKHKFISHSKCKQQKVNNNDDNDVNERAPGVLQLYCSIIEKRMALHFNCQIVICRKKIIKC